MTPEDEAKLDMEALASFDGRLPPGHVVLWKESKPLQGWSAKELKRSEGGAGLTIKEWWYEDKKRKWSPTSEVELSAGAVAALARLLKKVAAP